MGEMKMKEKMLLSVLKPARRFFPLAVAVAILPA
jgi:hypothetical protein